MTSQVTNAIVSGVMLAGLYVIAGLAWVLLFRAAGIFNFGTGQFIVLGAYLAYVLGSSLGLPVWLAFLGAVLLMALLGAIVQFGLLNRLLGVRAHASGHAPFAPVILTFGIATVIQHALGASFGTEPQYISNPLPDRAFHVLGNAVVTVNELFVWGLALLLLGLTMFAIRYTKWGIQMRAAAEQPLLASQTGIRIGAILIATWAAVSAMAAIAGVSYSYSSVVSPGLSDIGIRSLAPVIVGGMDSIGGVLPGAIIVALAENFAVIFFGESARDAAVMITVLLVLVIRPSGLFGTADIRRV